MEQNRWLVRVGRVLDALALALALWVWTLGLAAGLGAGLGDSFSLGLLSAAAWMLAAVVWLGRVLKWFYRYFYPRSPTREASAQSLWRHFGLLPLLAVTLIGLSQTNWPQSLVFRLHRPALEQFARKALAAPPRAFSAGAPAQRVGLYSIWRVERVPGGVRFVTRDSSFLDPSYDGFVFYPGASEANLSEAGLPSFPLGPYGFADRKERLDGSWFVWWAGSD